MQSTMIHRLRAALKEIARVNTTEARAIALRALYGDEAEKHPLWRGPVPVVNHRIG